MSNRIKKILLAVLGAMCLLASQAQVNFGARIGLSLSNQQRIDHEDYYEQSTKGKAGFHIGAYAEMAIFSNLYAQPGIAFTGKGARHKSSYSGTVSMFKISYVEFPLNIVYKHPVSFGKIYAGAGPVISLATNGKIKQGDKSKQMFEKGEDWKRGDLGFNLLAGVEFNNGFVAGLSFNNGFTDIYKHDAAKIRNRALNLSVGYLLNRAQ